MSGFNPLDMGNLARSVATKLLEFDPVPLDRFPSFEGAGVYALYYSGDFPAYSPLLNPANADVAIYVGRATEGNRTGSAEKPTRSPLVRRIRKHATSIRQATNLEIADFRVRYLVVEPIFVPLGESSLIEISKPVWNAVVPGFGSNDPGAGREAGMRSSWDTLHPGRGGVVARLAPNPRSATQIADDALEYLRSRLP